MPRRRSRAEPSRGGALAVAARGVHSGVAVDPIKTAARRRFDRWARSYERDRRSRFNAKPQERALEAIALRPDDRFLDVGCGTGAAVRAAAAVALRAVGVDIAPRMIARAEELAADVQNAEFVVGDSEDLPFSDGEFTAALCTASLHHYPNPRKAVAEMARVLVTGGRLALADGTGDLPIARLADRMLRLFDRSHVRLHRTGELIAMLEAAGFDVVGVEHLWDGGFAILCGVNRGAAGRSGPDRDRGERRA
jgi:SAM-dependent methyltransferase